MVYSRLSEINIILEQSSRHTCIKYLRINNFFQVVPVVTSWIGEDMESAKRKECGILFFQAGSTVM